MQKNTANLLAQYFKDIHNCQSFSPIPNKTPLRVVETEVEQGVERKEKKMAFSNGNGTSRYSAESWFFPPRFSPWLNVRSDSCLKFSFKLI